MSGTLTTPIPTTVPPFGGRALAELRERISGRVAIPLDPDWDAQRAAWTLSVDQRPALVVHSLDVADVQTAVRFAAAHRLRVAPQGTGHQAAPLGSLAGTMLLRTDLMRQVTIDPAAKRARVAAGALWLDVTGPAAEHGLAALAGSSADVGVVGYTLGGGVSWLARSHGLASNSVTAVEIVTADGELRRVDEHSDPELFWAVRGGGGAFGVVTALEFRLYPISTVQAGALFWPIERAADVMHAWREWTEGLPASVMSVGRVLRFPPFPEIPEPMRGRSFVVVEAVLQEPQIVADALMADLRRLAPEIDTFRTTSVDELRALHMDPPGPVPGLGDGALLREVTPETLDAFVAVAGTPRGEALMSAELRHLGAEMAPGRADGGVVSGLDGAFLLYAVGVAPTREAGAVVQAAVDDLLAAIAPWRSDADYLNFAERPVPPTRIWGDETDRLSRVVERVDPGRLFRSNHEVVPPNR